MFALFMKTMEPNENTSILDLGVTCDKASQESNYFEQFYPFKHNIVCAGTENGSHLEHQYPGLEFVPVRARHQSRTRFVLRGTDSLRRSF